MTRLAVVFLALVTPLAASGQQVGRPKVIQNRTYEKSGRHQLSVFGGFIPNDLMAWLFPVGVRYGYHITEMFAVEMHGSYAFAADTSLAGRMTTEQRFDLMNPRESVVWDAFLCGHWFPFYGKFALIGTTVAHFDLGIKIGIGTIGVRRAEVTAVEEKRSFKPRVAGELGAVAMAYLHEHLALRMDLTGLFFGAEGKNVKVPFAATLGLSIFLPSLKGY